jgi:hypothetical protein
MRQNKRLKSKYLFIIPLFIFGFLASAFPISPAKVSAANCVQPTTDYGTVTTTINVPAAGTYRIWSRIKLTTATSNTYLLEVGGNCYNIGGNATLPIGSWVWVDYIVGNTKANVTFAAANPAAPVRMIGNAEGVLLDRVILTQDTTAGSSCNPPVGFGDTCVDQPNVLPSVTLSASPLSGTAPLSTTLTAVPTDTDGTITKVEFFRGTTLIGTKTAAPWTQTVTGLAAGTYTYTAKATDNNGGVKESSAVTVTSSAPTTVKPGDANNDNIVGLADLSILSNNWGKTGMTRSTGDFSGDGVVGLADLSILSNNWGK